MNPYLRAIKVVRSNLEEGRLKLLSKCTYCGHRLVRSLRKDYVEVATFLEVEGMVKTSKPELTCLDGDGMFIKHILITETGGPLRGIDLLESWVQLSANDILGNKEFFEVISQDDRIKASCTKCAKVALNPPPKVALPCKPKADSETLIQLWQAVEDRRTGKTPEPPCRWDEPLNLYLQFILGGIPEGQPGYDA